VGNLEKVKRLVAEGADVADSNNYDGYTALLAAAHFGHKLIMHWLLTEGGSDVNEKDKRRSPIFEVAAIMCRFAAMQYLLEEHGALLMRESDNFGITVWRSMCRWVFEGFNENENCFRY
jgi:ankyrin repeat protein